VAGSDGILRRSAPQDDAAGRAQPVILSEAKDPGLDQSGGECHVFRVYWMSISLIILPLGALAQSSKLW
jgi:hypothetical protein